MCLPSASSHTHKANKSIWIQTQRLDFQFLRKSIQATLSFNYFKGENEPASLIYFYKLYLTLQVRRLQRGREQYRLQKQQFAAHSTRALHPGSYACMQRGARRSNMCLKTGMFSLSLVNARRLRVYIYTSLLSLQGERRQTYWRCLWPSNWTWCYQSAL